MKNIYAIIFLLFLFNANVFSQEYVPFVQEDKVWYYSRNYPPQYAHTYMIHMTGDTIIGGRECKKMYNIGEANIVEEPVIPQYRFSAFEEDRKVYVFYPNSTIPSLLYDFSKEVGEDITVNDMTFTVNKIETLAAKGRLFDIISLSTNDGGADEETAWITGIGSELEDITHLVSMWSNYGSLDSVSVNNENIFSAQIFREDATSIRVEKQTTFGHNDAIYDLQGRRITTPQKGGIYIRNGRKFLWN